MKSTLIKTAAATLVAVIAISGNAFAQTPTIDENINAEIAAGHEKVFNVVSASVEKRIAELQVNADQAETEQSAQTQTNATS